MPRIVWRRALLLAAASASCSDDVVRIVHRCEVAPLPDAAPGPFEATVEWTWSDNAVHPGYHQVMTTPVVGNLTDDNDDGLIDRKDVPDIVFTAYVGSKHEGHPGAVVALSGDDGRLLWSTGGPDQPAPFATSGVAIADLEGNGDPSVLAAGPDGLICFDGDGALRWLAPMDLPGTGSVYIAVTDLQDDGELDIVVGGNVVDRKGEIRLRATDPEANPAAFAFDLDGDGKKEILASGGVDGSDATWVDDLGPGWLAVGDLQQDGDPELVHVELGSVSTYHADGELMWNRALVGPGGGPPTIADLDGRPGLEVGISGHTDYVVLRPDGRVLWQRPAHDFSSGRAGSAVFDLDGDGVLELVYADERTLYVLDGRTGRERWRWAEHASATLFEYPVIADVDADGAAEIVVPSNDYVTRRHGITVFGHPEDRWAPAARIWHQHAFHDDEVAAKMAGRTEEPQTGFRVGRRPCINEP